VLLEDAFLKVLGQEAALGVIAAEATKVWMRSLVPKEKKPSLPAISLATAQTLDNSI